MTRIASFGQQDVLLQNTLRNQQRLSVTQQQITTGKKANDFGQLAPNTQEALSVRNARASVDAFRSTVQTVQRTTSIYEATLGNIETAVDDARQSVLNALAQKDAEGLMQQLEASFGNVIGALNTRINDEFVFSGASTDTPPVVNMSFQDFLALPDPADILQNDSTKKRALIDEGVELEFGQLADEVAGDFLATLHSLGNAPVAGTLDQTEEDLLTVELNALDQARSDVQSAITRNGLNIRRLEELDVQHAETQDFLGGLIGDIEDINLAEAVTRLNQQQTTIEASFRTIGTLSRLSLLDFI